MGHLCSQRLVIAEMRHDPNAEEYRAGNGPQCVGGVDRADAAAGVLPRRCHRRQGKREAAHPQNRRGQNGPEARMTSSGKTTDNCELSERSMGQSGMDEQVAQAAQKMARIRPAWQIANAAQDGGRARSSNWRRWCRCPGPEGKPPG